MSSFFNKKIVLEEVSLLLPTRFIVQPNFVGIEINDEYMDIIKSRLDEPFEGFDSADERMFRIPNDLNNKVIRDEYIRNHAKWFLNNHNNEKKKFLENVKNKYGDIEDGPEQLILDL